MPQKKRVTDEEDVWIATPLLELPLQELPQTPIRTDNVMPSPVSELQELPPTPATGLKRPVSKTEREMLYAEMDNLRKEKQTLQAEVDSLKQTVENVKLSSRSIEGNDDKCRFYTGVSWNVFLTVFTYLSGFLLPHMKVHSVSPQDQYFITLLKLRMDLPFEFIGNRINASASSVGDIFWKWIELIYSKMNFLIKWPDREIMFSTLPGVFALKFPRLTCIIDCFEIFIERPRSLLARAQCYSNYKKHSTVKVFIACTANGSVSFLSCAWGGRVSDIEIVRSSGFIDQRYHHPGDQILADRGFTLQDDFASVCGAELIIPAFTKGKKQLSAQDVEISRKISSVRIHIERVIGLIKHRFAILQGTLPLTTIKSLNDEADDNNVARIDKMIRSCAIHVNLSDGIVYCENESQ